MRAEISSGRHEKRHPYDWYVEPEWADGQLFAALGGFRREQEAGEAIWDPAAGRGSIGIVFAEWNFRVFLSDIVDNVDRSAFTNPRAPLPTFFSADFLELENAPAPCSIVCNPPYSYRKIGDLLISEAFARHALKLASRRVCLLLPNKWLASQSRYRLFSEYPPQAVLHLCQRPSMPPGDRIGAMGGRAFKGGMVDYCWIIWDVTRPTRPSETRTVWLPALGANIAPIEALA